jgi:hypothetical protein
MTFLKNYDIKEYRRRNQRERIRNKRQKENLMINTLEGKLTNNTIRWYEHILRMNEERIPNLMNDKRQ